MDPACAMTLLDQAKRKYEDLMSLSSYSEAEIRESCKEDAEVVAAKKYLKAMDALSELKSAMAPLTPSEHVLPIFCAGCRRHDALGEPCTQCHRLCCQDCLTPEPSDDESVVGAFLNEGNEPVLVDKWCHKCVHTWRTTGPGKAASADSLRKQLNRSHMQERRARSSTEDS